MNASPELTLYDFPAETNLERWQSFSPFVLQVQRALTFAKLPFTKRQADMRKLKQLNPVGQLPVLMIGKEKLADSTLIMHRIEQMVPQAFSRGLDARGMAEAWLWEEFSDTALYPHVLMTRWLDERGWKVVRQAFFGSLPAPLRSVIAPMIRRGTLAKLKHRDFTRAGQDISAARLSRILDALEERAPSDGFWVGAHVSAADLGLFAHLHSLRLPLTPWQAEVVAKRVRLSAYLDRVDAATIG